VLQLEAGICFAAFLALLALFLGALATASMQSDGALVSLQEKVLAERCCAVADAAYASAISSFSDLLGCGAEGNFAVAGGKRSVCLAEEIRLVQRAGKSVLEVKADAHYR